MKFPPHKAGLTLSHNEYKNYYYSIENGVAEEDGSWVSDVEREKALETGEIWVLRWYPETPVGFHHIAASTLEALMEATNK